MTNTELQKITVDFDDVKSVINKRKVYKKEEQKLRRKLWTLKDKYSFLKTTVDIGSNGTTLVNSIKKLFKEMGFKRVENVDKNYMEEDLRLWTTDKRLLIFEITGIDKETVKDDKAFQIMKHVPKRQQENPDLKVHGIFIVNHDNKKSFDKRHKKPFRKPLIDIAISHSYTLTTTIELLNAFVFFKKNKLTSNQIIDKLCESGQLKI